MWFRRHWRSGTLRAACPRRYTAYCFPAAKFGGAGYGGADKEPLAHVLVILTYWPEFIPSWAPGKHLTAINLQRLPRDQVDALVILGTMNWWAPCLTWRFRRRYKIP